MVRGLSLSSRRFSKIGLFENRNELVARAVSGEVMLGSHKAQHRDQYIDLPLVNGELEGESLDQSENFKGKSMTLPCSNRIFSASTICFSVRRL